MFIVLACTVIPCVFALLTACAPELLGAAGATYRLVPAPVPERSLGLARARARMVRRQARERVVAGALGAIEASCVCLTHGWARVAQWPIVVLVTIARRAGAARVALTVGARADRMSGARGPKGVDTTRCTRVAVAWQRF